eukprot:jgi/Mesen1/9253/ME000006S09254
MVSSKPALPLTADGSLRRCHSTNEVKKPPTIINRGASSSISLFFIAPSGKDSSSHGSSGSSCRKHTCVSTELRIAVTIGMFTLIGIAFGFSMGISQKGDDLTWRLHAALLVPPHQLTSEAVVPPILRPIPLVSGNSSETNITCERSTLNQDAKQEGTHAKYLKRVLKAVVESIWEKEAPVELIEAKPNEQPAIYNLEDEQLFRAALAVETSQSPGVIQQYTETTSIFQRRGAGSRMKLDPTLNRRIAFLFLTKGPLHLAPLWEQFFKGYTGLFSIYIHHSPDYKYGEEELPEVFRGRQIPSKVVSWGGANLVDAERRLLAQALMGASNERFVLLSESCIPLFSFEHVYNYIMPSNVSFVESYDEASIVGRGRYRRGLMPLVPLAHWRKGSQWFELQRDLARFVVADRRYIRKFKRHCFPVGKSNDCFADEHYLATMLHLEHGARLANRTVTYVDWKRVPFVWHPYSFNSSEIGRPLIEEMRGGAACGRDPAACHLFGRKFQVGTVGALFTHRRALGF